MGASLDIIGRCGELSNVYDLGRAKAASMLQIGRDHNRDDCCTMRSNKESRSVGTFHSVGCPLVPPLWLVTADARVAAMNGIQIGVRGCPLYN
jgi:hypothetical protein